MVEYFRHDTDIYSSDAFIRRQFGGSKVISIVVKSDSHETTLHPDTLSAMDRLSVYLQEKVPNVGKVMGFTDLVKRINQVFNADASPDGLPPSPSSIAGADSGAGGGDFGFGFGDFGFGFGFNEDDFSPNPVVSGTGWRAAHYYGADKDKVFTQSELFSIIDRAGNQSRGMTADDLVWELKRQVNYEGASYYEIPVDPKRYGKETPQELQMIVSNYLLLLSGNISDYANDPLEPNAIKATIQLRTMGMIDSHAVFGEIEKYVDANFPDNVEVTLGGTTMVESSLNDLVVQSQVISMMISVISIFIIISAANKSMVAGLMAMTPLSISILLNFAIMGLAGIKLNLGTSMVGAVSVCVGIDYTIHSLEAYKREYLASRKDGESDGVNFLRRVFFSSGKAIIINATSVGAGFAVMLLSSFVMLADFGLLVAFTMFSSSLVSLTVLPAMLALIKPKFIYNNR
jgi:predicted RND superfamily exporter protein